jgi:2'-5' RNA ligase
MPTSNEDLISRWAPTLHQATTAPTPRQSAESQPTYTGVMVAFYPSPDQARELAVEGGESAEQIHLTLAYLGDAGKDIPEAARARLTDTVRQWAAGQEPVRGKTNGLGLFTGGETVTYANVDAPRLPDIRQSLVRALTDQAGVVVASDHGYTPHMTLVYADRRDITVPELDLVFDQVVIAWAGEHTAFPLAGQKPALQVSDRPDVGGDIRAFTATAVSAQPLIENPSNAVVAEINGRQIIAGPAAAFERASRDPSVDEITAEHMLYINGRFVGAEVPNRNGALWSAGDLELARESVLYGPLNWLHEARHVIGTLADAKYVEPAREAAAETIHPHITATSAIWRWIYPDEAYVVQQASDMGQLWYSMECISKEVACAGPEGCGNTTSYAQYMAGVACEHVRQRASVRHFKNPVFLGGAVIVPPSRPGWAEADASVMKTASVLAEAAFDQAGQPDVRTSDWEQMMAQLVRFASK